MVPTDKTISSPVLRLVLRCERRGYTGRPWIESAVSQSRRPGVGAKHRSTRKRVTRTRSRRRTAPAQRLTAMAVGDEGQVPEYAQAGFGNTDGNGRVTPATTCTVGNAGESPANCWLRQQKSVKARLKPVREVPETRGPAPTRPCGPGKTSPVQAQIAVHIDFSPLLSAVTRPAVR